MRIVHLAAEFAPIAKAGGLADVLVGLCRELTRSGHFVDVILPKYDWIKDDLIKNLRVEIADFKCLGSSNSMWSGQVEGCELHLLQARHPARYFERGKIYGCEDDIARFIYFSRAALEYLVKKGEAIDILHLHDWHVSLCAPLVKDFFKQLKVKKIVLTIHNAEYQGRCGPSDLDAIGIKGSDYLTPEKLQDNQYPTAINLLKGGLIYSDALVPVSPSYAKEILTPKYGCSLDPTFQKMRGKMKGILNGIDTLLWDPLSDPYLTKGYAIESLAKGKEANRRQFPLDPKRRPWIGTVARLVPQKGPELLEEALKKTVALGGCFLLLGSSPVPAIQQRFDQLKETYKGNPQVFLHYAYDEKLAHLAYGALDFLIVPSHFEPCGLTQLIAMRYGTVPIVRATGGLKDTVFDWENGKIPNSERNGFLFPDATPSSMNATLERAFRLFTAEPASFQSLIRRGMESDFSWKRPAQEYLKLYRTVS